MARTDPQFNIRIPPELKESIEHAAKINNRSMNAEMVARLQSSFEANQQTESCLSTEIIKKMLLEQEQRLEEKFTRAFSERLNAIKE